MKDIKDIEIIKYIYENYTKPYAQKMLNKYMMNQPKVKTIKQRTKYKGYIYFLKEHSGKTKIGKTKNLNNRIFNLCVLFPVKPTLIYSFRTNDIYKKERELHKKYYKYRMDGEWFNLPKKEIEYIKRTYKDEIEEIEI